MTDEVYFIFLGNKTLFLTEETQRASFSYMPLMRAKCTSVSNQELNINKTWFLVLRSHGLLKKAEIQTLHKLF